MRKKSNGTLFTIAVRNVGRNGRRTALCVLAAGIAVFFCIVMRSWVSGMTSNMEDVVKTFDTGDVHIVSPSYAEQSDYYPMQYPVSDGESFDSIKTKIQSIDGVKEVFPRIMAYATLQDTTKKNALLWGLDIADELAINTFNKTKKDNGLIEGRFPVRFDEHNLSNECAIGAVFAQKSGLKIGDHIMLQTSSAEFSDKFWNPEIVGIFRFDYAKFDKNVILSDFGRLQKLLSLDGGTQQIVVYTDGKTNPQTLANKIKLAAGGGNVIQTWDENYMIALMQSSMGIFIVIYLVFMIVASFLIVNTMLMVIHERIKEIGMMGALGMKRGEIICVFFLEALVLSIAGSIAGVFLGGIVTGIGSFYPINPELFTGGMDDYPMGSAIFMQFSPVLLVQGFLFGVAVSSLCTIFPSLKSAFIEPVEALRR
jgi:putative ABC transport system permease protein